MVFLGLAKHRLHTDLLQRLRSSHLGYRFGPRKMPDFCILWDTLKGGALCLDTKREREKERLNLLLYQPLKGRDEDILYTVVKLHWTFIRTGKKYCKCYRIVLHIMLFLIDFFKKGCELFFFPHYVCAISIDFWPPP